MHVVDRRLARPGRVPRVKVHEQPAQLGRFDVVAEIGRGARFTPTAPLPPMPREVKQPPVQLVLTVRPVETVDMFAEQPAFLPEQERVRLEMLLSELLGLKQRLRALRA